MMKEVESGVKLKKVVCNDRSQPVLPKTKAKGSVCVLTQIHHNQDLTCVLFQFIYESEKSHSNVHLALLNQIQRGAQLKKVRTNDRSKPQLQGEFENWRFQLNLTNAFQVYENSDAK
jgi:neural Wiskott-Aldrich syndrome protein